MACRCWRSGWWNRRNNPEIDLVGTGRGGSVLFAGSIKWQINRAFEHRDYASLTHDLLAIPGADPDTGLLAVSRSGFAADLPLRTLSPDELLAAWHA
ncbi:MAG: hypothetical protein ACRDPW_06920 [Mycobacteriales bacterium]